MAGWSLKRGDITEYNISEDRIWSLFNFVFSDASRKRNTYKLGLIKLLLDNIFNGRNQENGVYFAYEQLFSQFAENYWNLVVKYDLRQMRKDGKSELSKVELIFKQLLLENNTLSLLQFESIDEQKNQKLLNR